MKTLAKTLLGTVVISCTSMQAATETITDNLGATPDWTQYAEFASFNPVLGTLTSIDVEVTTTLGVAEILKNTGTASETFQYQMSENVSFHDSTGLISGTVPSATTLTPYILTAGSSTELTTNVNGVFLATGITTPAVLAAYSGGPNFNYTVSTSTGSTIYGGGGVITATNNPTLTGQVIITFHYALPAVVAPELGIAVYSNLPVVFYPTVGNGNFVLQMATNLTTSNWVTVSNYIPMIGILVTNAPGNAYFRLH